MALIVEVGTGAADSESYISVSDADTYHTNRANTAWTGDDTAKEAALRKATDFMVQRYRTKWLGARASSTQALDWPRTGVVLDGVTLSSSVVPADVANACAELALRSLSTALNPDLTKSDDVKREKVDVIEVEYKDGARPSPSFSAVDDSLSVYLASGSTSYGQGVVSVSRG